MKPNNIKINNNDINARRNYKIHCDKNKESDEEKDKIYLNELDKDIKDFYMEKCGNIFNFLKEIYLCRYIDDFLKNKFVAVAGQNPKSDYKSLRNYLDNDIGWDYFLPNCTFSFRIHR